MKDGAGSASLAKNEQPHAARAFFAGWGSGSTMRVTAVPIGAALVAAALLAVFEADFYRSQNLHVLMQQC
jgi:hypothetical protein